jgi:hypothetical protein
MNNKHKVGLKHESIFFVEGHYLTPPRPMQARRRLVGTYGSIFMVEKKAKRATRSKYLEQLSPKRTLGSVTGL